MIPDLAAIERLKPLLTTLGVPLANWHPATARLAPDARAYQAGHWHIEVKPGSPYPNIETESYYLGKKWMAAGTGHAAVISLAAAAIAPPPGMQVMELRHPQGSTQTEKILYCVWIPS
ncbi:MAG: hypothetical protein KF690_11270 [Bacteroidetes bacterium]|nr:hypothetical protein [Bacteroidota bacterium]